MDSIGGKRLSYLPSDHWGRPSKAHQARSNQNLLTPSPSKSPNHQSSSLANTSSNHDIDNATLVCSGQVLIDGSGGSLRQGEL